MCCKSHVNSPSPSPSSFFFDMHDRERLACLPRRPPTMPRTPVCRRRSSPAVLQASHHHQPPAYSLLLSGFHSSCHARPWRTSSQRCASTRLTACLVAGAALPSAEAGVASRDACCYCTFFLSGGTWSIHAWLGCATACRRRGPFRCHHSPLLDALNLMTYFSANG